MICPKCGAKLNKDDEFCYSCGAHVSELPPYVPPKQPSQPPKQQAAPVSKKKPEQQAAPKADQSPVNELKLNTEKTPKNERKPDPAVPKTNPQRTTGTAQPPSGPSKPQRRASNKNGGGGKNILIGFMLAVIIMMAGLLAFYITKNKVGESIADNPAIATTAVSTPTPTPIAAATQSPTPSPSPSPSPTPSPTPSPSPTPAHAAAAKEHSYTVMVATMTWNAARQYAESSGGYLVAINDKAEFEKIKSLLSDSRYSSVKNVWIGACAPTSVNSPESARAYWNSSEAKWINGEPFTFAEWREGEPSGYDYGLNSPERYLQIFRPKADNYQWSFNDGGDDLSEYKEGTLAFIIEYER